MGFRRCRRPRTAARAVEVCEDRTLLSVQVLVLAGALDVFADASESIAIQPDPLQPVRVQVLVNGAPFDSMPPITVDQLESILVIGGEGENTIDLSGISSAVFTGLESIEVRGGEGDDNLIASADLDDLLLGGDGDDTLTGGAGNNTIRGGDGTDRIDGGDGDDLLDGENGADTIIGDGGNDTIYGGDGEDVLSGSDGYDVVHGGHHPDVIDGGNGNDTLNGGSGNDTLSGGLADDLLLGGSGRDSLGGGGGYDRLSGQGGNDTLAGGTENDTLSGGGGGDLLLGDEADDRLNGQAGDDTLEGGPGNDRLFGGPGRDQLAGNDGDDVIRGQGGNDTIFGGDGADNMQGGNGNDYIDGDASWTVSIGDATVNPEGDDDGSQVVFFADFENGMPVEFLGSPNSLESVQGYDGLGTGSNTFAGEFLRNASGGTTASPGSVAPETTTLVLSGLPEHTSIDISFLLAVIENWDGYSAAGNPAGHPDVFNVAVDGQLVYSVAFDQTLVDDNFDLLAGTAYTPSPAVILEHNRNNLFSPAAGGDPVLTNDAAYDLGLDPQFDAIPHTASTLMIQWYASGAGWEGGGDESWAIDNVEVILNGTVDYSDATFTVTLSRPSDRQVSVNYATADATATTADQDYLPESGKLVFAPGEVTRTFDVVVRGDTAAEGDETFVVNLTGAVGAVIVDGQGTATIVDDDSPFPDVAYVLFAPGTPEETINDFHEMQQEQLAAQYAAGYRVAGRWTTTATDGSGLQRGDPTTITWGILPDGTTTDTSATSNLIARLDTIYNESASGPDITNRTWYSLFVQMFDRWAELSGNNYVFEAADDGATFPSSQGSLGVRPDIRIAGRNIDGNFGILAFNYFPNNGDMVIDSNDSFFDGTANNSRRLRNVLAHEHGHGLAFNHVIPGDGSKLMEPSASTAFDGPQYDDILAIQRLYGDELESQAGNDTAVSAFDLGPIDNSTVTIGLDAAGLVDADGDGTIDVPVDPAQTDFISIDGTTDIDFYRFSGATGATADIVLTAVGPTYLEGPQGGSTASFDSGSQVDLTLELLDGDGVSVLATSNTGGIGQPESITSFTLATGGNYFVRVSGAEDLVQTYQLDVMVSGGTTGPPPPGGPGSGGLIGDTLFGGSGSDTLVGAGDDDLLNGGGGADVMIGRGGQDTLLGGGGNDTLDGSAGDDLLQGQGGIDVVHGGAGDDTLLWRIGDSSDSLDGGTDADTVIVRGDRRNNQISFSQNATAQLLVSDGAANVEIQETISRVIVNGGAGADTISVGQVDRVSTVMVVLNGQGGGDTISAAGADVGSVRILIDGGRGNDTLVGSNQDDSILGGDGNDVISAGSGEDTVRGGNGGDVISGNDGDDLLVGDAGNDTLSGGDGDDRIDGNDGADVLGGGSGNDTIAGQAGGDNLNGGAGHDDLDGGAGRDTLLGGGGDDTLDGDSEDDFLVGNAGNDLLRGGHGSDRISGGSGDDSLLGGDGDDVLQGGDGDDILFGTDGDDRLNAGRGNDTVLGGDGKDSLFGGSGNDLVLGGDDSDFVSGQGGSDTVAANEGDNDVVVDDVAEIDESFSDDAFAGLLDQLESI